MNETTTTITRNGVIQVPSDLDARFRAALADGEATTLVADRKAAPEQADLRVVRITNVKALRTVEAARLGLEGYRAEYPEGITIALAREWGYDPKGIMKGDLRRRYLRVKAG